MSKYNVGDTVYYLSGTETYRQVWCGTVAEVRKTRTCSPVYEITPRRVYYGFLAQSLYPTEEEAKAARIAYYNQEVEEAQKALDNARARLSNAVGWRERAEAEAQE